MKFEITLALTTTATGAQIDLFSFLAHGGLPITVRIAPTYNQIMNRAKSWSKHLPSQLAQNDTAQGRILAAMLGLRHPKPLIVPDLTDETEHDPKKLLNSEQLQTFRYILNREAKILDQDAPCGAGKTFAVAIAIAELLKNDDGVNVVLTTRNNAGLKRLVEETVDLLGYNESLVILSGTAKELYADDFEPYRPRLLVAAAEELVERMSESKGKSFLVNYIEECRSRPKKASEKQALSVMEQHKHDFPRVTFLTLAMLEDLDLITSKATHIIVDEAGQAAIDQLVPIICKSPHLQQMVYTGGERQLLNYVQDIPDFVRDF